MISTHSRLTTEIIGTKGTEKTGLYSAMYFTKSKLKLIATQRLVLQEAKIEQNYIFKFQSSAIFKTSGHMLKIGILMQHLNW